MASTQHDNAQPLTPVLPYALCRSCLSIRFDTDPYAPCKECEPAKYTRIRFASRKEAQEAAAKVRSRVSRKVVAIR